MVMTEPVGCELRAEDISGERLENYSNVCSERPMDSVQGIAQNGAIESKEDLIAKPQTKP